MNARGRNQFKDRTDIERFDERHQPDKGCWIWTGHISGNGYGQFQVTIDRKQRSLVAHKWRWEYENGPVPEGKQLDHLCSNRRCVNPAHLEPVDPITNVRRSRSAKLTDQQAIEIYEQRVKRGVKLKVLADLYGVSESTIYLIAKNGPIGPRNPQQNARHRAARYPSASTQARRERHAKQAA